MKFLNTVCIVSFVLSSTSIVYSADRIKADTADPLNSPAAWVGNTVPGPADIAVWDSTVMFNTFWSLGGALDWSGIRIANPALPAVIVADGNTLTLQDGGIDMSSAAQDLTMDNNVSIGASQTWNVGPGRVLTVSSPLAGTAGTSLTKSGEGTLVLSSTVNGTYAGTVSIDQGVLQLDSANGNNNSAAGTGMITNNGAVLRANRGTIIGNALHFNGTSVLDVNGASVVFDGAWSGSGTVVVTNLVSGATLTAGGNGNGGGNWADFTGTILLGTSEGTLRFNNGGGNNNLGNAGATIDLGTATAIFFSRNRNATVNFGELRGGPNTTIQQGASSSGTANYNIGGKNTSSTFAGRIIDAGPESTARVAVNKVGTGTLTLSGTNTFSGGTTVSEGVLQIGDGGTSGLPGIGPITVEAGASLVFNRSDTIEITNLISGAGTVVKTGANTLTFYGTNSSAGITIALNEGTFAVGDGAQIAGKISLNAGTTLAGTDAFGFGFNGVLAGNGTVSSPFTAASGSALSPGDANTAGALTFNGGLTLQDGVILNTDLSNTPENASANDRINVTGDLDISGGVSTIAINPLTSLASGTYTLITYSGNLVGDLSNLTVSGAFGTLANPPGAITFTPEITRPATDVTWVGGGANLWDTGITTNWISGTTPLTFLPDDNVRFDNTGAANPVVNLVGDLSPNSVVVDSTTDYTFAGQGRIVGSASLAKSNSNTLTITQTNNAYAGPTAVTGGTLAILSVANAGQDSSIGRASASPTNFVLMNATLRYEGLTAQTDRGLTLEGSNARIEVVNASENVAFNGRIEGPGALVKTGEGRLTLGSANGYTGGTIISNGVLALGSNEANSSGDEGGLGPSDTTVTFYGGTLELFGFDGSQGNNYNTLRNPLIVPEGQEGTLRLFPRGPANAGANSGIQSSLTGGGTLNLVVNYVRDNLSGDWSAFTGLINAISRSGTSDEMRVNNNFGYANASIFLNDFVLLTRADADNTVVDIGQLGGTSLSRIGVGNNGGNNTTWRIGAKNTSSTFEGTITDDAALTKVGTGTLILNNIHSYSGPTVISNGVLALVTGPLGDASLDGTALISIATPGTLDVMGRSDDMLMIGIAVPQTIEGNGTLNGNLLVSFLGTVAPGFSIGTLTVSGNVDMQFGTAVMEISRGQTPNSDKLVAQNISLSGTIVITNSGGNLQVGDTFDLFDGNLTDAGVTVQGPPGTTFDTSQLFVDGTVTVTSAPVPPEIVSIIRDAGNVVVQGTGGIGFGTYHVYSSTNVAAPVSTWVPIATNFFEFDGTFSFTNAINPALDKEFFLIQQQ